MHSRTFSDSVLSDMPSIGASRLSTVRPSSLVVCDSCVMFTETTSDVVLSTSGLPSSSTIEPRTAGTTTCRVWFTAASCLYCAVSITCRYQSRPPSVAIMAAAIR